MSAPSDAASRPGRPPDTRFTRARDRAIAAYTDRWGVLATLTLVGYLASPPRGTFRIGLLVAVVGLVAIPWVRRDWRFWAVLTVVASVGPLLHPLADLDNHHFLELYWLAAVTLSCLTADPVQILRRSARLLVGAAFAFAVLWKLLSPDFLDGTFLTYLVHVDVKAASYAAAVGLQDPEVIVANREAIDTLLLDPTASTGTVQLVVGEAPMRLAQALTVSTFVLEAAVAVTFLVPLRGRWRWLRDATLLTFILTTYPVIPVVGFGLVLTVAGLAQTDLRGHRGTGLYLAVFAFVGSLAYRNVVVDVLGWLTA